LAEPVIELQGIDPDPERLRRLDHDSEQICAAWTSPTAVDHFVRVFGNRSSSGRVWRGVAIGERTAERARAAGLEVLRVASRATARDLVEAMSEGPLPDRVLFAGSEKRREELPHGLRDRGVHVEEMTLYRNRPRQAWSSECLRAAQNGAIGLIAVYSPSAVHAVVDGWARHELARPLPPFAALGETTARSVEERAAVLALCPPDPGEDALIEEAKQWWQRNPSSPD
jgi:uroporphyrinogen-III synthase